MRFFLLIAILLSSVLVKAQEIKRTAIWYFGYGVGLDFNTSPPTPLYNSNMNVVENSATISDTLGNLILYTNGQRIWNKNHQIMDNGDSLLGHWSSFQGCIAIPNPTRDNLFYVFTTDGINFQRDGLNYNIIDLSSNSGLGKVTRKNILLFKPTSEKVAAVKHANGFDYWVTTTPIDATAKIYTFHLNSEGVTHCPIVSDVGRINQDTNQVGAMKFSLDGSKMVVSEYIYNQIRLYKFDNLNGKFSEEITINNLYHPIGVEFSPNGKLLYVTTEDAALFQYDISNYNVDSINASKLKISDITNSNGTALQIALDSQIYVAAPWDTTTIHAIKKPDSNGLACQFTKKVINFSSGIPMFSLPNFVSSYFYKPRLDVWYKLGCTHDTAIFYTKSNGHITFTKWYLKKDTVLIDSSSNYNPTFILPDSGYYSIFLITDKDTVTKQIYKGVPINPSFLGMDKHICNAQSLLLDAGNGYYCYKWQDTLNSQTLQVNQSGKYYCTVTGNDFCSVTDTIAVTFHSNPVFTLGDDTFLCEGFDTVYLKPSINGSAYLWSTTNTGSELPVTAVGSYWLELTDSFGCIGYDTIVITENCEPLIYIPTAFTPNADNLNDRFLITANNLTYFRLRIFTNNTTQTLFDSYDITHGWDGTHKGELCPIGNYLYILEYKTIDNNELKRKAGKVLLLK